MRKQTKKRRTATDSTFRVQLPQQGSLASTAAVTRSPTIGVIAPRPRAPPPSRKRKPSQRGKEEPRLPVRAAPSPAACGTQGRHAGKEVPVPERRSSTARGAPERGRAKSTMHTTAWAPRGAAQMTGEAGRWAYPKDAVKVFLVHAQKVAVVFAGHNRRRSVDRKTRKRG